MSLQHGTAGCRVVLAFRWVCRNMSASGSTASQQAQQQLTLTRHHLLQRLKHHPALTDAMQDWLAGQLLRAGVVAEWPLTSDAATRAHAPHKFKPSGTASHLTYSMGRLSCSALRPGCRLHSLEWAAQAQMQLHAASTAWVAERPHAAMWQHIRVHLQLEARTALYCICAV